MSVPDRPCPLCRMNSWNRDSTRTVRLATVSNLLDHQSDREDIGAEAVVCGWCGFVLLRSPKWIKGPVGMSLTPAERETE